MKVADWWATDDVKNVAPDLNDDYCNAILLMAIVRNPDAELGINWEVLTEWARVARDDWSDDDVARILKNYGKYLVTEEPQTDALSANKRKIPVKVYEQVSYVASISSLVGGVKTGELQKIDGQLYRVTVV